MYNTNIYVSIFFVQFWITKLVFNYMYLHICFFQGIIGNDVILCLDTEITEKQQKMYL